MQNLGNQDMGYPKERNVERSERAAAAAAARYH
jgi:hypothetical protein